MVQQNIVRLVANRSEVAVLVVDMQEDFCSPQGALSRAGADTSVNEALVATLETFVSSMRSSGSRVIWIRQRRSEWLTSPAMHLKLDLNPRHRELCATHGGAEIAAGLNVHDEDLVVDKYRYSAFVGTHLELALRSQGISTVIVTGTAMNACVDSTSRDASELGFNVIIPKDMVGYTSSELAEASLVNLGMHFAYICTSEDIKPEINSA